MSVSLHGPFPAAWQNHEGYGPSTSKQWIALVPLSFIWVWSQATNDTAVRVTLGTARDVHCSVTIAANLLLPLQRGSARPFPSR